VITTPPALEDLLSAAVRRGTVYLRRLTAEALRRLLAEGGRDRVLRSGSLFTPQEQAQLAGRFSVVNAAAELLGRLRIRRQHARATRELSAVGTVPTSANSQVRTLGLFLPAVRKFDEQKEFDWDDWIRQATTPREAIDWFRSLMPVKQDPELFGFQHQGEAFRLAVSTDQTVLRKVHEVILDRMETGKQVDAAPRLIAEILDDAGISYRSNYPTTVFRTNIMQAYRHGSWQELKDPDVAPMFPVWQYLGIADGRERMGPLPKEPDHHRHFGKYWPMGIAFEDVRGRAARDVINCRCNFRPISLPAWRKLLAQGAVLQTGL
jgi:hypothetical protein